MEKWSDTRPYSTENKLVAFVQYMPHVTRYKVHMSGYMPHVSRYKVHIDMFRTCRAYPGINRICSGSAAFCPSTCCIWTVTFIMSHVVFQTSLAISYTFHHITLRLKKTALSFRKYSSLFFLTLETILTPFLKICN